MVSLISRPADAWTRAQKGGSSWSEVNRNYDFYSPSLSLQ